MGARGAGAHEEAVRLPFPGAMEGGRHRPRMAGQQSERARLLGLVVLLGLLQVVVGGLLVVLVSGLLVVLVGRLLKVAIVLGLGLVGVLLGLGLGLVVLLGLGSSRGGRV